MDKLTRIVVVASALAVLALQTWLGARGWGLLQTLVPAAFVLSFVLGRVAPRAGLALTLVAAYVYPSLLRLASGSTDPALVGVWAAAVIGSSLAIGRWGWSLPGRWRLPLAMWALAIALSWPVVVWRELDYTPALINQYHMAVSALGPSPPVEIVWIAHVVVMHLAGLLWIDALWARYGGQPARFEREVIAPLGIGSLITTTVALYQMFGNMDWLNSGLFAHIRRASAATQDANAYGAVAAIAAAGAFAFSLGRSPRAAWMAGATLAAGAFSVGTWGSSSRTALLSLVVALGTTAYAMWRATPVTRRRLAIAGGAALVVVAVAGVALVTGRAVAGPIQRMAYWFDARHPASWVISELWNRNHYGLIASNLFLQFPLAGIGVGSFNTLTVDYAVIYNYLASLRPDNAQNWFRHQLVEFGLLGSVGWIVFVLSLFRLLVRRVPEGITGVRARAVKGMIAGLGLASCLGMPTQSPFVLITFWTVVFWCATLSGWPEREDRTTPRAWATAWIVTAAFVVATAWVGAASLRVPYRAAAAGWGYTHGFYGLERDAAGAPFRWAGSRAVVVVPRQEAVLKLVFWVHHPDVREHPVRVRIWHRDRLSFDQDVRDTEAIVRYMRLAPAETSVMIEVAVSRTWRPGAGDPRELGVALADWTFVPEVPAGGIVID